MVSAQMSVLVAIALVTMAVCCLARLAFLHLYCVYPAFVFFLVSQIATTLSSSVANVRSESYAWAFLGLLVIEWLAYGFMIRELYNAIFSRYPGIAILGQCCLYGAALATVAIFAFGITSAQEKIAQLGTSLVAVEFVSHCLLVGFAAFVLLLLFAISRYPLELHKNILLNCAFFSLILLGEIAEIIANRATSRHLTANLNLSMSMLEIACLAIWPMLLSREGQTEIFHLRRNYNAGDEARLLDQLSTVNALLLRATRK